MRSIILFISGLLIAVSGFSQKTADIGIWGGGSNYMGDIETQTFNTLSFPSFGGYFRYNFHYRTSLRAMLLMGNVSGSGLIQNQEWEFRKNVQDLTLQAEINYLRYMIGNRKASFTSYLTGGIGVMYYPYQYDPVFVHGINPRSNKTTDPVEQSVITATIPFGMGFKFNVGTRMGIGVEYQMRKLLNDKLDNLDDPLAHFNNDGSEVIYTSVFHNNDWVGFLGLHITYKIYLGGKPCPAYDYKR